MKKSANHLERKPNPRSDVQPHQPHLCCPVPVKRLQELPELEELGHHWLFYHPRFGALPLAQEQQEDLTAYSFCEGGVPPRMV